MGPIFQILFAVGTLALPELFELERREASWRAVGVLGLLPLPHLLAGLVHRFAVRGRFRVASFVERLLATVPVLGQLASVLGLAWLEGVEATGWMGDDASVWPEPRLLLGLVPFLALSLLAIDARARLQAVTARELRRVRGFHLRLFLSALLPFVLYLVLSGLIASTESWRVHIEEVALFSAAFTVLLLAVFVLMAPRLLSMTWDTTPLPHGPLRVFLEKLADRARFRCRNLLVWRTGAQMANATVVGFTSWGRVVMFSDVLLDSLQPLEVGAVFGHEMGHARRRHAPIFAAWAIAVLLAADLVGTWLAEDDPVLATGILIGALLLWALSFSYLSRRFELEADLESLDLLGSSFPLIGALEKVTGAHAYEKSSWRHFSTADRVRFLLDVERDPEVGRKLRKRLARWSRLGVVLLVVVCALQVRTLAGTWSQDELRVDLRLGRYTEAQEALQRLRASGTDVADERVPLWIQVATALPEDARTPEAIEAAALAAARAREPERATLLLELAYLRGRTSVGVLLDALDARAAGEADGELEARLPEDWASALSALQPGPNEG